MPINILRNAIANQVRKKNVRPQRASLYPEPQPPESQSQPPGVPMGGPAPGGELATMPNQAPTPVQNPGLSQGAPPSYSPDPTGGFYNNPLPGGGGQVPESPYGGAYGDNGNSQPMGGMGGLADSLNSSQQAAQNWASYNDSQPPDWQQNWMDSIFGGGDSFDPIQKGLQAQEDAAQRAMAEMYASRGMAQSGALAGGLADINRQYAQTAAEKYMEWKQQQIANKTAAAQLLFQDSWKNLDFEHQKAIAELMFELDRKAKYGEDYNPDIGDYEMQMIQELLSLQGQYGLDDEGKAMLEKMLRELGYGPDGKPLPPEPPQPPPPSGGNSTGGNSTGGGVGVSHSSGGGVGRNRNSGGGSNPNSGSSSIGAGYW